MRRLCRNDSIASRRDNCDMTADRFDPERLASTEGVARPFNVEDTRALVRPLYEGKALRTGESFAAHADGIAAIVSTMRPDPDLLVAAQLFGVHDVLRDPDEWLRSRFGAAVAQLVVGPAAADAALRTDTSARGRQGTEPGRRPARGAAADAAGDGERPAGRAAAARIEVADAALLRGQPAARRGAVRARDAGSVRAAGQSARRLAAEVGTRGPVVPFPGAGNLQVRGAHARRAARRARVVHRRGADAPAPHGRRGRIAGRDQRSPEAHLQHLEQDAREGSRLRTGLRRARAARHRRRGGAVLPGPLDGAFGLDAGRARVSTTTSRARSRTATSRCIRSCATTPAARSKCRSVRDACTSTPNSASLRIGATKRAAKGREDDEQRVAWLRQLLAWRAEVDAPPASGPARDERIYVLTPQARVVELPVGGTPIDFAYHIHSELGHRCRGARVNGAIVPLNTPLASGQTVEIVAAKTGGPSRDWLNPELGYLRSARSRAKVRQWFNALEFEQSVTAGREIVEKELQRLGKTAVKLEDLARRLGFDTVDDLCAAATKEEFSLRSIEQALVPAPALDEAPSAGRQAARSAGRARQGARRRCRLSADSAGTVLPPGTAGRDRRLRDARPRRVDPPRRLLQSAGADSQTARARGRGRVGAAGRRGLSGRSLRRRAGSAGPAARHLRGVSRARS